MTINCDLNCAAIAGTPPPPLLHLPPSLRSCTPRMTESLKSLIEKQRSAFNSFTDGISLPDFTRIFDAVAAARSRGQRIHVTGVGKSGQVARLGASLLKSIGASSSFLSPLDALHGDIGDVSGGDVALFLSKSGTTRELVDLLPSLLARGATVAVLSCAESRDVPLARAPLLYCALPLVEEVCPLGHAPTTSTILQLTALNVIVAALAQSIGLSHEQYALNHPSGQIGRRLVMQVDDVMVPRGRLALCGPGETLGSVLSAMTASRLGCVVVEEDKVLVGIFTDGDLRRALQAHSENFMTCRIGDVMSRSPATIPAGTNAYAAMLEMERSDPATKKKRVAQLPVVSADHYCIGIITLHDLISVGL